MKERRMEGKEMVNLAASTETDEHGSSCKENIQCPDGRKAGRAKG